MAEKAVSMLRRSLDAFVERDVAAAEAIATGRMHELSRGTLN